MKIENQTCPKTSFFFSKFSIKKKAQTGLEVFFNATNPSIKPKFEGSKFEAAGAGQYLHCFQFFYFYFSLFDLCFFLFIYYGFII